MPEFEDDTPQPVGNLAIQTIAMPANANWNGDIFVVSNGKDIVIESITPESNPLGDARVMNGAVLQPDNDSFTAFDSSGQPSYYRDYENFEAHNVDPGKTGEPLVIKYSDHPEGASLVKAVSLEDLSEARDRSAIEEFSVLTVVAEAPHEGAFRPPVSGADKTSHYTIDDLDFSKLQNVDILDSQKDISEFDLYKTATFASWTTSGDPARYTHPDKYHDGYGDYQMDAMAYAFMALHSNYSDAEKPIFTPPWCRRASITPARFRMERRGGLWGGSTTRSSRSSYWRLSA